MITFVFLIVYALFIYLLMSDINYLINLFDVLSWDIICVKRDLFAMILHYIVHVFLGILFSLKINISFFYHILLCRPLLLWFFPFLSSSSQIFIQSVLAFNQVLCILDAPTHSLFRWLTRYLILPRSRFSQL